MLEVLQFIFQDAAHFFGFSFLLALVCYGVSSWFTLHYHQ
jgi:hypothetical protein